MPEEPQSAVAAVFKRIEALGAIMAARHAAGSRRDEKTLATLERLDFMERQVSDELAILVWEGASVYAAKLIRKVTP